MGAGRRARRHAAAQQIASQPSRPRATFFKDAPEYHEQISRLTPEQQALQHGALSTSQNALTSIPLPGQPLQSQFNFAPIEQNARANFQQNTIPSLAERFTSLGSGNNALSSPAFKSQLGLAGAGLEGELARLASEYGLQQQQLGQSERNSQNANFFNLLNSGLMPSVDTAIHPHQQSGFKKLLGGIGNIAANAAGNYLGLGNIGNGIAGGGAPAGATKMSGSSSTPGFGQNAYGFGGSQLGQHSSGQSALNNQLGQFANPSILPSYQQVIQSMLQGHQNRF